MSDCKFDVTWDISTLEEAYEKKGVIIAQDKIEGSGVKTFAVVKCVTRYVRPRKRHLCDHETFLSFLSKTDRHWYEVIRTDRPVRLFLDLKWCPTDLENTHTPGMIVQQICNLLQEYVGDSPYFRRKCLLVCDRPGVMKSSFHVVFPDAIFHRINGDLKMFVLGFIRWVVEVKGEKGLSFKKRLKNGRLQSRTVINTAVYTKHRCFRALNQSNLSDKTKTPLMWYGDRMETTNSDTLVQPHFLKTDWETQDVISRIIAERAPMDKLYPLYPESVAWRGKRSKNITWDRVKKRFRVSVCDCGGEKYQNQKMLSTTSLPSLL